MKKDVIFWPAIKDERLSSKYGNFSYFEQSRKAWKFWCDKNNCIFFEFTHPVESDLIRYRPQWQKCIFVFDELRKNNVNYNQIALIDSTSIPRWDCPNFFNLTDNKFTAWRDIDNLKWVYESVVGYKDFFNGFDFDFNQYINSGFMIFNKDHEPFFSSLKSMYIKNIDTFINLQDNLVKKGNDQTPINYLLQIQGIDVNLDLPVNFNLTHLNRKELLGHNWQINEDQTPFFIKYGFLWRYTGIPKNQRTSFSKQVWDFVKHNYIVKSNEEILKEMDHKDTAKYTTTKLFKEDLLDIFRNSKYKNKTIVEIGGAQGQSTRLLSHIFKKVISVEWDDSNLLAAIKRNQDRPNVQFIKMDLYNDDWNNFLPKNVDVVFIDAGHQYHQVKSDILNSVKMWANPVLIFDDYGAHEEVKIAIDEQINIKTMKFSRFIGANKDTYTHALGRKLLYDDREGIICNLK
jgi:predicted O-methyltransferase YrrM